MHIEQAEGRGRRDAFLVALQQGRSVTGSAQAAGINRTLLYKWRDQIPGFAAAWDEARETSADLIEDEALRRAMQGVEKPVFYRGQQIGVVTTYSDRLLALLLQRRRPETRAARPVPDHDDSALAEESRILSPTVSMDDEAPAAVADPVAPEPDANDSGVSADSRILSPTVSMDDSDPAAEADLLVPWPSDPDSAFREALACIFPGCEHFKNQTINRREN